MAHGEQSDPADLVDSDVATSVAETMQALATPSRLRILGRLTASACTVGELARDIDMDASAVSHQLRVLRLLGLVTGSRDGRQVTYTLYDDHVGQLLEEAISHVVHLRQGLSRNAAEHAVHAA